MNHQARQRSGDLGLCRDSRDHRPGHRHLLIIYGAYASVGDQLANASDGFVPLDEILSADQVGNVDVVITDAETG